MSVHDKGYSRNVLCSLNLISIFLLFFTIENTDFDYKQQCCMCLKLIVFEDFSPSISTHSFCNRTYPFHEFGDNH